MFLPWVHHTLNTFTKVYLYWDGLTCAQTGLKCISFRPASTLLPQTHRPQCNKRDQSPTIQKGPPHLNWRLHWGVGEKTRKASRSLASYALKVKDDVKYECHAISGRIKANHAAHPNQAKGVNGVGARPQ